jgi:hypothetical protein
MASEDVGEILNNLYNSEITLNNTPPKRKKLKFDTPENRVKRLKDNTLFLSPTTRKFQNSFEKASNLVNHVYDKESLRNTRKNIIHSIDHILNHDLVKEDSRAAEFVTAMERQIQNLKEEFTKKNCQLLEQQMVEIMSSHFPLSEINKLRLLRKGTREHWGDSVIVSNE